MRSAEWCVRSLESQPCTYCQLSRPVCGQVIGHAKDSFKKARWLLCILTRYCRLTNLGCAHVELTVTDVILCKVITACMHVVAKSCMVVLQTCLSIVQSETSNMPSHVEKWTAAYGSACHWKFQPLTCCSTFLCSTSDEFASQSSYRKVQCGGKASAAQEVTATGSARPVGEISWRVVSHIRDQWSCDFQLCSSWCWDLPPMQLT